MGMSVAMVGAVVGLVEASNGSVGGSSNVVVTARMRASAMPTAAPVVTAAT